VYTTSDGGLEFVIEHENSFPEAKILNYSCHPKDLYYDFRNFGSTGEVTEILGKSSDVPKLNDLLKEKLLPESCFP
jgi:hypothetical protein